MLNQASARQIKPGAITDQHIAAGASISEAKLNIDWATRGAAILATRTVVDFVQVNGKAVAGNSGTVVVTAEVTPPPATADGEKGAIVQDGKNRVILRDAATGEPLIGVDGKEVYGKLTRVATDYVLAFFTKDELGAEAAHTQVDAVTIDFQYPQRFDLNTVSETFASNEKFVDGAANVSERLDIAQLAKDVFGGAYTLDKDGQANNGSTIVDQLADEVAAREAADGLLQDAIDAEVTARVAGVQGLDGRLTTAEGEIVAARGASVSLAAELARIEAAGTDSNDELVDARKGTALTGSEVEHASLDERLEATDTAVKANIDELTAARNGKANLSAELTAIRTSVTTEATARDDADDALDTRIVALEAIDHKHIAEDKQVLVGDALIGTSTYTLQSAEKYVAGNKSLQVYLNGFLQMVGVHYNEVEAGGAGTGGTGVNFAPDLIEQGDVIQLRWTK